MEKPDVALHDKQYRVKMKEWVAWHVANSQITEYTEFLRWFMRYSKGMMSPHMVLEAWTEHQRGLTNDLP